MHVTMPSVRLADAQQMSILDSSCQLNLEGVECSALGVPNRNADAAFALSPGGQNPMPPPHAPSPSSCQSRKFLEG